MNSWQCLKQIKSLLVAQTWTGSATAVFPSGSVIITQAPPRTGIHLNRMPYAFIGLGSGSSDPVHDELPDKLRTDVIVALSAMIPGDPYGEAALIGRNIQSTTDSRGRGILELEEELFNAVELLNEIDGVVIQFRAMGSPAPEYDETHGYIVKRAYRFEMDCTASRQYSEASKFAATEAAGTVTLTWTLPPSRYDRLAMILRFASGSTAPADKDGGTGITVDPVLGTTEAHAPGAGTYSYRLITAYDEDEDGTADRWSTGVTTSITFT